VRDLVARYPGRWELYNIEDNRTEMHDLALEEPERPADGGCVGRNGQQSLRSACHESGLGETNKADLT
jgi:hypothetical protein